MARSNSGESVLSRMVRIFEAIDPDTPAITVGELAHRAGLPATTTSRLVSELVGYGWLRREGRRIRVGVRMWELAVRASPALDLREAAMPYLQELQDAVGQHAQLSVLDHRELLTIEHLSARGAVRIPTRLGGRLPLHATAAGLVLLAHASAAFQESVLAAPTGAFTPTTSSTCTTRTEPAELRLLLCDIRHRGHAYCTGSIDAEATSVAAPVRDCNDRVAAAVSVLVPHGPSARAVVPPVLAAASGVSRSLRRASSAAARP